MTTVGSKVPGRYICFMLAQGQMVLTVQHSMYPIMCHGTWAIEGNRILSPISLGNTISAIPNSLSLHCSGMALTVETFWWLCGKEPACNAGNAALILWLGRSPVEGNGYTFQCSCLENPMDRGACQAIVRGVKRIRHDSNSTTTTTVRASSTFKPVNFNTLLFKLTVTEFLFLNI